MIYIKSSMIRPLVFSTLILSLMIFIPTIGHCSASYTKYVSQAGKISDIVYLEAIGIASFFEIDDMTGTKLPMKSFKKDTSGFVENRDDLSVIPVTRSGMDGLGYAHVPITKIENNFIEVIYNAETGQKTWLKHNALYIRFDDIKYNCCINVFLFRGVNKIKLYSEPTLSSDYKTLSQPAYGLEYNFDSSRFKILDRKGNWLKVVKVFSLEHETLDQADKGWIRIRDDNGHLLIWFGDGDMEYH